MSEDKLLKSMNVISTRDSKWIGEYLEKVAKTDDCKSRRYSSRGYWTLEVFHNGWTLIPEEGVECNSEPTLDRDDYTLDVFGERNSKYIVPGRSFWRPLTVTYSVYAGTVGAMLIENSEEVQMIHHANAELTYWLGVDSPDRTWVLKNWRPTNMQVNAPKSAVMGLDLTFIYSEAILTRH
jgi:hypothetical protein